MELGPKAADPIPGVPVEAKPLRIVLFVLTALSAAAALFLEPALAGAVERGALGAAWLFLPIGLYGLFFLSYAVDRYLLVRRRRYPAGRAFFQMAFGAVFALLLLPSTIGDWSARRPQGTHRLLMHNDPEVRAITLEALGFRGPGEGRAAAVAARLDDRDRAVRETAQAVLRSWAARPEASDDELRAWVEAGASRPAATTATTTKGGGP